MSDADQVIDAEHRLAAAHLTLDLDVIEGLLHDDYLILQLGGRVETKSDVLDAYRSGERHWDHAAVEALSVDIYGSMARVVGVWTSSGANAGFAFDYQARFISIWVSQAGEWKNLSYASAEIAAP